MAATVVFVYLTEARVSLKRTISFVMLKLVYSYQPNRIPFYDGTESLMALLRASK